MLRLFLPNRDDSVKFVGVLRQHCTLPYSRRDVFLPISASHKRVGSFFTAAAARHPGCRPRLRPPSWPEALWSCFSSDLLLTRGGRQCSLYYMVRDVHSIYVTPQDFSIFPTNARCEHLGRPARDNGRNIISYCMRIFSVIDSQVYVPTRSIRS